MPSCQLDIGSCPGGSVEESAKSTSSVAAVAPVALLIMLLVLMIQLQSFSRLFLVLSVAPFKLIGVVAALLIAEKPLGFVAGSAGPRSRIMSEGLSGVASIRTTTSSAAGFGSVSFSSHSSSLASEVILLRSSRLLIVVIVIASLLRACRPVAHIVLSLCVPLHNKR